MLALADEVIEAPHFGLWVISVDCVLFGIGPFCPQRPT